MITGQQFREIREYKGLSLRDVAKFCNVSPQLIGQIEQGKKVFTDNNYQQIIDAMNLATVAKANGKILTCQVFCRKLFKARQPAQG